MGLELLVRDVFEYARTVLGKPITYACLSVLPIVGCGKSGDESAKQPSQQTASSQQSQDAQSVILGKWVADDGTKCEFYDKGTVEISTWFKKDRYPGETKTARKSRSLDYEFLTKNKIRVKEPFSSDVWSFSNVTNDHMTLSDGKGYTEEWRRYQEGTPKLEATMRREGFPKELPLASGLDFTIKEGYEHSSDNSIAKTIRLKNTGSGTLCWRIEPKDDVMTGLSNRHGAVYKLIFDRISLNKPLFGGQETVIDLGIKVENTMSLVVTHHDRIFDGSLMLTTEEDRYVKAQEIPFRVSIIK